jgi:hemerythrin superfamily protein
MNVVDEPRPDVLPARHGLGLLLSDHHHRLEAKCRDMLGWAYTDDTRSLYSAWGELEAELLDHMAAEEEVILPTYATHAPEDARRIRDDHVRIRSLVTPLGIDVELHEARVERLHRLVDALAAHSASEDAEMYPWAADNIALVAQRLLFARIGRWFART